MKAETTLAVGPAVFRVGSDWTQPVEQLRNLYAPYPPADRPADFTVRLEAGRPWRRWVRPAVRITGDYSIPDTVPVPLSMGLLAAEMAMNLQMALGWRAHLLLHASAAERGGRTVVMSGESGSGKSTLAALLGESGWRLFGDEFSLLGLNDGLFHPFPRPVSLKNEAIGAMAALVPDARFGPRLTGTPKGDIRHLVPRADALARMHEAAPPALILFPRFGADRAVRPVPPAETFMRLTEASTNYAALGEAGFAALTALVRRVPAFAISYPDGRAGVELVEELLNAARANGAGTTP